MAEMPMQKRREECRREVRAWLAHRAALVFEAEAIHRRVNADGNDFSDAEVKDALAFLVSAKHVCVESDADGATPYYQITAAGTLAHERRHG